VLKINGLVKSYRHFPVLRGLNMNVERGDVYGFLGTNGCGKTTTINIICNIIPKNEGIIEFDKEDIKIGYLPESPALFDYMNGFEYLDFIGACCEYEGDIKTRTAEVLELTGMYSNAERFIKGYSRGMIQRIGIAAALYAKPDLLILDEPTSALDPEGRAEVMSIIKRLADSGSTIILCTHILTDVERVANKVGILRDGVIVVEDSLVNLKKRFGSDNSLTVLTQNTTQALDVIKEIECIENAVLEHHGEITVNAKSGISEAELFYKTVTTLASKQIVPEGVWFKRLTLEQIYLGINSGYYMPYLYAGAGMTGGQV